MKTNNFEFYRHPKTLSKLKINSESLESEEFDVFSINKGIPNLTWPIELADVDNTMRISYEHLAEDYDKFADIPFKTFRTSESFVRADITQRLNLKPDSCVLEVGAGDGRGSEYIAKELGEKGKFFVQELSPAFLEKAGERLQPYKKQTQIEFSVANAIYLPFADNTFDAAHHFGGISTFSDVKRCLHELVRVVKPGGKIVVGDESMAPWLRDTEFGKIMMNSNPLLRFEIPFDKIPKAARNVKVDWIMMGAFFLLEMEVGEGEPVGDYFVPIPSQRGGNHWIRYYGQLEGVTDETKKLAYEAQKKSGKSMHEWLEDLIKIAVLKA